MQESDKTNEARDEVKHLVGIGKEARNADGAIRIRGLGKIRSKGSSRESWGRQGHDILITSLEILKRFVWAASAIFIEKLGDTGGWEVEACLQNGCELLSMSFCFLRRGEGYRVGK
jgi:hypothetical protein